MARTSQLDEPALAFLKAYFAEHGHAPNMRELAAGVGISSPAGARKILQRLEAAGHVRLVPGIGRGVVLR